MSDTPRPMLAELVERMAVAGSALPWQRVTGPEGMEYLRAVARGRLERMHPAGRELVVAYAEDVARRHPPKPKTEDCCDG